MKRQLLRLLSSVGLILSIAGFAFGAGADGKWTGTLSTPAGEFAQSFTLKVDGDALTGTMTTPDGKDAAIADGKASSDKVSFSVTFDFNGMPITLKYAGVISADQIAFDVVLDGPVPRTFQVVAKKA